MNDAKAAINANEVAYAKEVQAAAKKAMDEQKKVADAAIKVWNDAVTAYNSGCHRQRNGCRMELSRSRRMRLKVKTQFDFRQIHVQANIASCVLGSPK